MWFSCLSRLRRTIGADVLSWLYSRGSECICGPSVPPDQETHQGGVVDDSWQCSRGSESVRDSVFSFQSVSHHVGAN